MTRRISGLSCCLCFMLLLLMAFELTGCCGRKKTDNTKKDYLSGTLKKSNKKKKDKNKKDSDRIGEYADVDVDLSGELPLRAKDERTKELYEKLDYANKLFKSRNYDSALREINRIRQQVDDDSYLKLQTWALSAMIYNQMGNTSKRKHSYRKMMESLDEVKKDARYKKAYEDGMVCQGLIASATQKGDKKYDFD